MKFNLTILLDEPGTNMSQPVQVVRALRRVSIMIYDLHAKDPTIEFFRGDIEDDDGNEVGSYDYRMV